MTDSNLQGHAKETELMQDLAAARAGIDTDALGFRMHAWLREKGWKPDEQKLDQLEFLVAKFGELEAEIVRLRAIVGAE